MTETSPASAIRWDEYELIPAVIQDAGSHHVLMVGFMNQEAYRLTRLTDRVHFYSRSRAKLWRKGETSGHELVVDDVRINCEANSLLILATPLGPTCHEGYETCYFRRVEPDESLTVIQERAVDPAKIYGADPSGMLEDPSRLWYRAYEYLRDNDISAESGTSRRLRTHDEPLAERLADELRELAGVLDGSHAHRGLVADVLLEGSQSIYWTALIAIRSRVSWSAFRPDRALSTVAAGLSRTAISAMLRSEAESWLRDPITPEALPARCHATVALVAQACHSAGVEPGALLQRDIDDLRSRPYLASVFDHV